MDAERLKKIRDSLKTGPEPAKDTCRVKEASIKVLWGIRHPDTQSILEVRTSSLEVEAAIRIWRLLYPDHIFKVETILGMRSK